MICAGMPLAAAKDSMFPSCFGRLSARRVPAFGIISSTHMEGMCGAAPHGEHQLLQPDNQFGGSHAAERPTNRLLG
jgi:hypothetical protein